MSVSGHPDGDNNGRFHIHTDHLGSVAVLTKYSDGYVRGSSRAYYYPFGAYRLQPSTDVTGRRFTGQQENMEWGLYYYNARYYVPGLGRFASADTIVPDPVNPRSFNRYSYALNNPLKYTDPSGHCATDPYDEYYDYECWQFARQLQDELGLSLDFLSLFDLEQLQFFEAGLASLENGSAGARSQVVQELSDTIAGTDFLQHLRENGGWDVIGIRGDFSFSGFQGVDISGDILFNFDALELSFAFNLNYTLGIQAGASVGAGVFIGFNAPSNDSFAGWGSGLTLSIAIAELGGTVQWDVADRILLLGNAMPERHTVRSGDTKNLAVMYTPGAEVEFSVTVAGYSWVRHLYHWETE